MQTGAFARSKDCVMHTLSHEGVLGFYKGMSSPLVATVAFQALLFGSFETFSQWFSGSDGVLRAPGFLAASCAAALVETSAYTPFEHVKTRLQTQYQAGPVSPLEMTRRIYAAGGLRGLYSGFVPQLMRECPGNAIYFGTYAAVRHVGVPGGSEYVTVLTGGALAGVAYWVLIYPFDSVKALMQTRSLDKGLPVAGAFVSQVKSLYKQEGVRGFYKGLAPCAIRAIPANAVTFLAFEFVKDTLTSMRNTAASFTSNSL